MALKAKITKTEYDALSDALKEVYKADGDNYLLDAEGVENVDGLKSALQKQKDEVARLKKDLVTEAEKYKDIDPERAREALKALADIDDKKLVDKGEYDRLLKKRSDEYDVREVEFKKQIDAANVQLDEYQLINPVREAATNAGVLAKSLGLVLSDIRLNKKIRLNDKRQPIVVDKDGDPTDITLEKYFTETYKTEYPNLYAASGAGGSGAIQTTGGANGKKTITRKELNELSPVEQRTISLQASKGEVVLTD